LHACDLSAAYLPLPDDNLPDDNLLADKKTNAPIKLAS
jgi:hypothetical protein